MQYLEGIRAADKTKVGQKNSSKIVFFSVSDSSIHYVSTSFTRDLRSIPAKATIYTLNKYFQK